MAESSGILHGDGGAGAAARAISGQRTKYGAFSRASATRVRETCDHAVRAGDSLVGLAVRYNVPVDDIKKMNNLWNNADLHVRVNLRIPLVRRLSPLLSDENEPDDRAAEVPQSRLSTAAAVAVLDRSELSAADFLSSFDTRLLQLKSSVEKLESSSALDVDVHPLSSAPARQQKVRFVSAVFTNQHSGLSTPELQLTSSGCSHVEQDLYDL